MSVPLKIDKINRLQTPGNTALADLRTTDTYQNFTSSTTNAQTSWRNHSKIYNIDFQVVPPHSHRKNSAERDIQTWKYHLVAGLATCYPNFPPAKWDRLMPQCNITINILIFSWRQPKLAARDCLYGNFDFNGIPLAPSCIKVVIHETVDQRDSWSHHDIEGWYIGPALEHYCFHKCYIPSTAGVKDVLTLE